MYGLWQIDDGNLSYYYTAESTVDGIYYRLKSPSNDFPSGFYKSERDAAMASYNQQLQMAQTSGDESRRARGMRVDDDTTLPSQRIKEAAEADGGMVLSSGDLTRKKRKEKK